MVVRGGTVCGPVTDPQDKVKKKKKKKMRIVKLSGRIKREARVQIAKKSKWDKKGTDTRE